MNHSFNIDIASEVGVEGAIIFENIQHWVLRNEKNGENIKDGQAWVYNSRSAWCEIFPYMGEKQVRNALERLLDAGLIVRGTYSYGAMNRTYWYGLAERAKQFGPKGPNHSSAERAKPETIIDNSINETPPNPPKGPCEWEEDSGFMKVANAYSKLNPSRVNLSKAWAVWKEHGLSQHADQILNAIPHFAGLDQWKKDGGRWIPNLAKWLEDGAWRSQNKVPLHVTAEELAERERIAKAGMRAMARIESDKRLGRDPDPDDVKAYLRWQGVNSLPDE